LSFFVFFTTDGVIPDFTFYMWGNLALVLRRTAQEKMKITTYGPIKNLSPLLKGKGCLRERIRKLHSLHIISLKLILIPRPWNVITIQVFQPV
jgi:hypothetical protein